MNASTKNQLTEKIFIGFLFTIDLKIQLNQTKEWKQATVIKDNKKKQLSVVRYNDSEYIGEYFEHNMLTMKDVTKHAKEIKKELSNFLPEFDVDSLKICLFPQVFVS